MAIDWVMRLATRGNEGITWVKEEGLSHLYFAGDIAALSDTTQGLQCLVESVGRCAGGLGLVISEKKTKNMLPGEYQLSTDVLINHNKVETVENFTYLGSSINNKGIIDHGLNCRMGKASAAINQLRKIWNDKKITLRPKLHFYNSSVLPTLLYGCESWQLTQAKKKNAFDTKCLRKILGIHWSDHVTNKEVRIRSGQPLASATICKRRMSWLGHVTRLPPTRPAQQALRWTPAGQRRRGRPRMNWRQTVDRDVKTLANNISRWNALTASCFYRRGNH